MPPTNYPPMTIDKTRQPGYQWLEVRNGQKTTRPVPNQPIGPGPFPDALDGQWKTAEGDPAPAPTASPAPASRSAPAPPVPPAPAPAPPPRPTMRRTGMRVFWGIVGGLIFALLIVFVAGNLAYHGSDTANWRVNPFPTATVVASSPPVSKPATTATQTALATGVGDSDKLGSVIGGTQATGLQATTDAVRGLKQELEDYIKAQTAKNGSVDASITKLNDQLAAVVSRLDALEKLDPEKVKAAAEKIIQPFLEDLKKAAQPSTNPGPTALATPPAGTTPPVTLEQFNALMGRVAALERNTPSTPVDTSDFVTRVMFNQAFVDRDLKVATLRTDVDALRANKADKSDVNLKADKSYVDNELSVLRTSGVIVAMVGKFCLPEELKDYPVQRLTTMSPDSFWGLLDKCSVVFHKTPPPTADVSPPPPAKTTKSGPAVASAAKSKSTPWTTADQAAFDALLLRVDP